MSTGKKLRNAQIHDGTSFMDKYEGVSLAAAEKLSLVLVIEGNDNVRYLAWYGSSTAITLTDYDAFPKGSIIFNEQAHTTSERTAAGWVTSVARS